MPTLTIQLPGLAPVNHVLKDETMTIGRMKGNNIVIEDSSISLMHAKITRKNGEFYLKDLNSTNGTLVNGQPVGEARLRDLDRVRFADISGQFLAEAEAVAPAAAEPRPTGGPAPRTPLAPAAEAAVPRASDPKRHPFAFARRCMAGMPYVGGLAAIAMLGFLGWRFWQINPPDKIAGNNAQPLVTAKEPPASGTATRTPPADHLQPTPNVPAAETGKPEDDGVGLLARKLKQGDPAERRRAAEALHGFGPKAKPAAEALRAALQDPDPDVQMWAALTLVNIQAYDKGVIPVLVRVLKNDNAMLRQVACLSLGLIPYEGVEKDGVVPALAETAGKDGDQDVRKAAVSALSIIAPDLIGKTASN